MGKGSKTMDHEEAGGKKRVWTPAEDELLRAAVQRHGEKAWSRIADELPGRVGKQCRDRWCNHLSPDLDKKTWTEEDDEKLFAAVNRLGNQWAEISRKILPGRSDLSIKNRYYSRLRREHRRSENAGGSSEMFMPVAVPSIQRGKPEKGSKKLKSSAKGGNGRGSNKRVKPGYGMMPPIGSASSASVSPNTAMFGNLLPNLGHLEMIANNKQPAPPIGANGPQTSGLDSLPPPFPEPGGGVGGGFFQNSVQNYWPNPFPSQFPHSNLLFSSPYSPITSLSTTPVPSPPRSPSTHPVPVPLPSSLAALNALGSAAASTSVAQTNSESGSRPTSPTFSLPISASQGGGGVNASSLFPHIGNFWLPVNNAGGGVGSELNSGQNSGTVSPIPSGMPASSTLSNGGTGGNNTSQAGGGGGANTFKDSLPEMSLDFPGAYTQFPNMSLLFNRGGSPNSSPSQGPVSLKGNGPGGMGTAPIGQTSEWFPTIGSRGLEFRQHFRPIYGSADSIMGEHLPPSASTILQPSPIPPPPTGLTLGSDLKKKGGVPGSSTKSQKSSSDGSNTGRWQADEQQRFQEAIGKFGTSDWSKITEYVKTRTIVQVRSHAQKYFLKHDPPRANSSGGSTPKTEGSGSAAGVPSGQADSGGVEQALASLADGGNHPPLSVGDHGGEMNVCGQMMGEGSEAGDNGDMVGEDMKEDQHANGFHEEVESFPQNHFEGSEDKHNELATSVTEASLATAEQVS